MVRHIVIRCCGVATVMLSRMRSQQMLGKPSSLRCRRDASIYGKRIAGPRFKVAFFSSFISSLGGARTNADVAAEAVAELGRLVVGFGTSDRPLPPCLQGNFSFREFLLHQLPETQDLVHPWQEHDKIAYIFWNVMRMSCAHTWPGKSSNRKHKLTLFSTIPPCCNRLVSSLFFLSSSLCSRPYHLTFTHTTAPGRCA